MLPEGFELVLDAQHVLVAQQAGGGHVWVYRKSSGVISGETFVAVFEQVSAALEEVSEGAGLVIDTRDATGNNDPAFEAAVLEVQRFFFSRFSRRAVLVRTAVGHLQIHRLERDSDSGGAQLFASLPEAMVYLDGA